MRPKPYRTHMGLERLLSYSRLAQLRDERRRPSFRGVPLDVEPNMQELWTACMNGPAQPEYILCHPFFARLLNRQRTGIWPRPQRHRNRRRIKLSWLTT